MERPPAPRLASVDALRGLTVAAMLLVNDAGDWSHVHPWLEHAPWDGVTPADLIFPLFLFVMGVSMALSLLPRLAQGAARGALLRQVLWRSLRLIALGLALQALSLAWLTPQQPLRWMGVLQRIGLCYALAGAVVIVLRDARWQWAVAVMLLVVHSAMLLAGGSLAPFDNVSDRLDTWVLGPHAYRFEAGRAHDPEGLLGTLSATAGVLIGVRAGDWLRRGEVVRLVVVAALAWSLGQAASEWLPLNKNLWSASFVLWTAGVAMGLVVLAHRLVDRRGWPALGRSLGVNAIAAYAIAWVLAVALEGSGAARPLYHAVFERVFRQPELASAAYAAAFTAVVWALMQRLGRRGWRFTI